MGESLPESLVPADGQVDQQSAAAVHQGQDPGRHRQGHRRPQGHDYWGARGPACKTEGRSPRSAAVPTPTNRIGTDNQATTLSMARHGPANHEVKSGVVVDCMEWTTPPMAQAGEARRSLGRWNARASRRCPGRRPQGVEDREYRRAFQLTEVPKLKAQVMRKTPAPMMTAPAKAARTLCWDTDVRLIDPFWTPHHRPAPPTIRPSRQA